MKTTLIIGGGVAGLSAGIHLALAGERAIICEQHTVPGGNLTGWDRGGCHIDNCIHWLTGTNPASAYYSMWRELGALNGTAILQPQTLYTCEHEGESLSLDCDMEKTKQDMLRISPRDRREILSLFRAVEVLQLIDGIGGKNFDRGMRLSDIFSLPALFKYLNVTVEQLSRRFRHPLIRKFISSFWGDEFGALAMLYVFATFMGKNGGIPVGGSRAMAERMANRFTALGGELLLGKRAVRINREGKRALSVTFSDGETIEADNFIIAADPASAFGKLLELPPPRKLGYGRSKNKEKRFSSLQCAFRIDGSTPPWQGDIVLDVPKKHNKLLPSPVLMAREFSHEESFAPKDSTVVQTMAFVSEEGAGAFCRLKQKNAAAYRRLKKRLAAICSKLIEKRFPELSGRITPLDTWTPATYKRYTSSEIGSYMSFILPKGKLPKNKSPRIKGISNVFLATQWQKEPGGLPIAAERGKRAAELITRRLAARVPVRRRVAVK